MNTAVIGLSISIVICIIGFIFQKNKFYFAIEVLWVILLTGLNTYSADWEGNAAIFDSAGSVSQGGFFSDGIYNYLAIIAKSHGVNFVTFNFILSTFTTILIAYVVLKYAKRPNIVISLLLIYPFIDNIIQKRWYYAMGIAVFGLQFLLKKSRFINSIIFILFCVIAVQIHEGALLYFTIPLFLLVPQKYRPYLSIGVLLIGSLARSQIPMLFQLLHLGDLSDKASLYFQASTVNATFSHYLFWVIWQLIQVYIIYRIKKENKDDNFINGIWNLNLWSICIIPLYSFDPVFSRMFRSIMIFNFITVSNQLKVTKLKVNKLGFYALIAQLVMVLAVFYVSDIRSALGYDFIVLNVFRNNVFLNWLLG